MRYVFVFHITIGSRTTDSTRCEGESFPTGSFVRVK